MAIHARHKLCVPLTALHPQLHHLGVKCLACQTGAMCVMNLAEHFNGRRYNRVWLASKAMKFVCHLCGDSGAPEELQRRVELAREQVDVHLNMLGCVFDGDPLDEY